jgi:hypothetical protein
MAVEQALSFSKQAALTAVKSRKDPWLLGMEVDALDSLAASVKLALCKKSIWMVPLSSFRQDSRSR